MPDATQLQIGQAIKTRRRALKLTLRELAAKIGTTMSTLSKVENGRLPITFQRLEAISQQLNVDLVALLPATAETQWHGHKEAAPLDAQAHKFGTRRSITRPRDNLPVDGGIDTLKFQAADLLEKLALPLTAEILITDSKNYGPYTRHPGEEFNYVLSGELEFRTDVYAPVRLKSGESIYFDGEMRTYQGGNRALHRGCCDCAAFSSECAPGAAANVGYGQSTCDGNGIAYRSWWCPSTKKRDSV